MKKKITLFILLVTLAATLQASESTDSAKVYFENAFTELKSMLEGKTPASFERAVFISENPFHDNRYSYKSFQNALDIHLFSIENLIEANDRSDTMNFIAKVNAKGKFNFDDIRYTGKEKKQLYENALKNWAIFKYMTDTTATYPFYHLPFSYASNDPFGKKNWGNSQVLNLLASEEQRGNCFALTGLFKILSDRLSSEAKICTAPQHIYIQHQDPKGDYYNVELATAGHPGDGMIQTLTYTTNEAIMSGIALREYNEKESIGLCLVNLAKSYEHKFNSKGDEFILKCAELALEHDSLNLNALLLKQQALDERVKNYAVKNKVTDINRLKTDKAISGTYFRLQKHLSKIYELGYRQMPLYMQQMILDGFSDEQTGSIYTAKNPSPFTTVKPKDPKDEQYWTLSHGAFQEVFEHRELEPYGHFILRTSTNKIASLDVSRSNEFLIDPVAFAYDFGARMYNAQLGIFTSVDPSAHKMLGWSPYAAFNNNPILFVDPDGREVTIHGKDANATVTQLQTTTALKLSIDQNGKLSATLPQAPVVFSKLDVALFNSISDKGVNVNLYTTQAEWYTSKDGSGDYPVIIGAYEGSEVVNGKVETTQIFNLGMAEKVESAGLDKTGNAAAHEILESFHGGKDNPGGSFEGYNSAHSKANNEDSYKPNTTNYVLPNKKTEISEIGMKDAKTKVKLTDDSPSSKSNKFKK